MLRRLAWPRGRRLTSRQRLLLRRLRVLEALKTQYRRREPLRVG